MVFRSAWAPWGVLLVTTCAIVFGSDKSFVLRKDKQAQDQTNDLGTVAVDLDPKGYK